MEMELTLQWIWNDFKSQVLTNLDEVELLERQKVFYAATGSMMSLLIEITRKGFTQDESNEVYSDIMRELHRFAEGVNKEQKEHTKKTIDEAREAIMNALDQNKSLNASIGKIDLKAILQNVMKNQIT